MMFSKTPVFFSSDELSYRPPLSVTIHARVPRQAFSMKAREALGGRREEGRVQERESTEETVHFRKP